MDNSPLFKPFEKLRRVQFPRRPPPERMSSSVDDTFAAFIPSRRAQIIYIT